ncbi:MAG: lactonase family protein [Proteobacteria bacterium]|jgi:6-phosphogluconolactonase|nr:lactonase family protein [Pseudomonadota bacterium]MDA1301237.1 lactonase family protein [Pseudomonadota bacterium]
MLVLVGTETRGTASVGIYGFSLDEQGNIAPHSLTQAVNPTFLALHPHLPVVYAVREVRETGAIVALRVNHHGELQAVDSMNVPGDDPCHIEVCPRGRYVSVSSYTGGSLTTIMLAPDGGLLEISTTVAHHGRSIDPMRQRSAHVHSSLVSEGLLYVADLGLDEVDMYPVSAGGSVDVSGRKSFRTRPGAGPRHLALTRDGRHLYVVNELDNTVLAMERLGPDSIVEIGQYHSLPEDYDGPSYCAHIALSPDERFVYASNRGHDSIVVFERQQRGELELVQHVGCGGAHPRHFAAVGEHLLLVANKFSDRVSVLSRDPGSGLVQPDLGPGRGAVVPAPTCVLAVSLAGV